MTGAAPGDASATTGRREPDGSPALEVDGLRTTVSAGGRDLEIVRGVSFAVSAGETLGIVGESGSGKSFTALSIADLLPAGARVAAGDVRVGGRDVASLDAVRRRELRGASVAMVYQNPMTSLNPMMRIGPQVREALTAHGWSGSDARRRTIEVLDEVGLPRPERMARLFPHHLSGGMRQRVLIAIALAPRPKVLIADEPTTALDVTIQQQIIELVARLRDEYGLAVVWITHDLGVIARIARRVLVMYAGRVVEEAATADLFHAPTHPYSAGLVASIPPMRGIERGDLPQIGGTAVAPASVTHACPFEPRCPQRIDRCAGEEPELLPRGRSRSACWVPPREWVR